MSRWLVLGALLSVGLVVAITLTPLDAAASTAQGIGQGSFVLEAPPTKIFRSPSEWWPIDDRSLNILLFVPLGFVVALMPRRWFLPAVVVALLAPVVVEGLQWLLPVLRRDPQWQDVADNMVGVVVGVLIAVAARWGAARYRARDGARAGARASRRP
jgi:glycopeptide antibiotics resistance protein